jgi:ubiquinone/menaquinone biosynthesis C-methylase UbiE
VVLKATCCFVYLRQAIAVLCFCFSLRLCALCAFALSLLLSLPQHYHITAFRIEFAIMRNGSQTKPKSYSLENPMTDTSPGKQPQGPSPSLFFRTMSAYQQTEALKAAIELDLFTAIAAGNNDAESLGKHCSASSRGVRILCDFLTLLGFLTKSGSKYQLTQDSALFLDRRSPACVTDATRFLATDSMLANFRNLADVVRHGGTTASAQGSTEPDHPMWVDFARGMAPLMRMPAQAIAEALQLDPARECRILDIAAGHGVFGITLAQKASQAQVTALDWSAVLEVAKENAAQAGVADRYHVIVGSAFDADFGKDYDVILLTNFLHHFDAPTNIALLRKVRAALKPGGRAVTLEFIPNDDRISPPEAAAFSLTMLASTPAGDAYTFAEFDEMFRAAGFGRNEQVPIPQSPEQLIISYAS